MKSLLEAVQHRLISTGAAAGQSDLDTSVIDMKDYDAVSFVTIFGAIDPTATPRVSVHESDADAFGTQIASTSQTIGDTSDNRLVVHDLIRPKKRYLGVRVERGLVAADSTVLAILAILYKSRAEPISQLAADVASSATYVGAGS